MSRLRNSSSAGSGKLGLFSCRRKPKKENRLVTGAEFFRVCDVNVEAGRLSSPGPSESPLVPILSPKSTGSDLPWNQSDRTLALASSFFLGKVSFQGVFLGRSDIVCSSPSS